MSPTLFKTVRNGLVSVTAILFSAGPAWAQAAAAPSPYMSMVFPVAALGIMYFLMIRPQMKKQKMQQEFLAKLKRGDEVLTSGGILGRIEGITDLFITLEISPSVRVRILRSQISSLVPQNSAVENSGVKV